ncbi:MAG: sulfur carrier protein ThiS [Deltaproteobacteria bacterium]|jgi:thiamine biosynthesis protein ThiS|nr:sulfur carrier protein ThiS [Deltaproteobacteria bacterium]MCW8892466.1 sulfur carrier protein ThiS [Deltaproteobacteria bacterium]MCW9049709.1 sulfur carrier protein ThiS [Deltaproteobacteria bacterium]
MQLIINGEAKQVTEELTVTKLLAQLMLSPEQVVVELNHNILPVDKHSATELTSGDSIEIVHFVGGG